jgi:general secretion pathway protein A
MTRQAAREVFGERIRRKARSAPGATLIALGLAGVAIAILAGIVTTLVRERMNPPAAAAGGTAPVERIVRPAAVTPARPAPLEAPAAPPTDPGAGPAAEPAAEPAPVTPPEPLASRLAAGELATGTDTAFAELFRRWDLDYRPEAGPACDQARAMGLSCLLERGTWGELAALNRPAILVLTDRDGREHQVVLNRIRDDTAELLAGETVITVPLGELLVLWYGEYLLMWRPEAGDGRALTRNSTGTDVLWLRRALGDLRGTPVLPAGSALYDPPLEAAVREFQRSRRIAVDGIAGAMTLVSLNDTLGLAGRPRLRESD